jgi:hypothetical protein
MYRASHLLGGINPSKIAGYRRLKCAALKFRATADPAHQIRIGQAIRSRNDGSHNRLVCTPGRGVDAINPSADYFADCASRALLASSARDAKLAANSDLNERPHRIQQDAARACFLSVKTTSL